MKLKGGKASAWSWEQQTNVMVRQTEWRIPLNFGGHDGENTVGELKDLLKMLPEEATFAVHEDEKSGRETIYVYHVERRVPTVREQAEQLRKLEDERRLESEQQASMSRLRVVQAKTKARRAVLKSLQDVDGAIHMVQNQALASGDPDARATFQEELDVLLFEKARLQEELLKV